MQRMTRAGRVAGITPVIVAGGGIGGLALGLTLHQIGVPCLVLESVRSLKPLGVGINLQPNAVRELAELGIRADILDTIGVPVREWALVGLNGREIHAEPRGLDAGYRWPQYAVHRGKLHMALAEAFRARAGDDALLTGHRVDGYIQEDDGSVTVRIVRADARIVERRARLLIACDGIHSVVRAQMHPDQPPIHWGGAIMWRGVTRARPVRSGASFVGLGTNRHRMVFYPISRPDDAGLADINWIAEVTVDPREGWQKSGWFKPVPVSDFLHHFEGFGYDGLDVPALLSAAEIAYENPMIDRDPAPSWVDGRVALLGDAAHPMYPTGSNGASQAMVDARVLGACLLEHGLTPAALSAYDATLREPISDLVLRNREAGPFGLLDLVDARCGGHFDDIEDVVPRAERDAFMARYKNAAGYARTRVNTAPPTIAPGARIGVGTLQRT